MRLHLLPAGWCPHSPKSRSVPAGGKVGALESQLDSSVYEARFVHFAGQLCPFSRVRPGARGGARRACNPSRWCSLWRAAPLVPDAHRTLARPARRRWRARRTKRSSELLCDYDCAAGSQPCGRCRHLNHAFLTREGAHDGECLAAEHGAILRRKHRPIGGIAVVLGGP